ncbi:MAG: DUF6057 family protein [Prevotella sp.]|nr:DUF6057 family protein [Prevotella sp.]
MKIHCHCTHNKAKTTLYAMTMFVILWSMWYFFYHYSLQWLEGFSFFTTLPEVMSLSVTLPDDILNYAGAFLLQFYYYPVLGAALQALFAVVIMLCAMAVVNRLFDNPSHLLWLAALPVPFFVGGQYWDFNLTRSLTWIISSLAIAVVVYVLTIKKRGVVHVSSYIANIAVEVAALVAIMGFTVYNLGYKDRGCREYEHIWKMEHLAETRQWDALLEIATPEEAQTNDLTLHYALLALLEKGCLPETMYLYDITTANDFWFKEREEPMCRNYNALLFRSLGVSNEVIHNTFQQQLQSEFGVNFTVLRRLVETNLEAKNYALAKKYMHILSHSTVMKHWVEDRKPQLEAIRNAKPKAEPKGEQFRTSDILVVTSEMYNLYPDNRKCADMVLCGLLAEKNFKDFFFSFKVIAEKQYAHGERIPRYYQEALLLLSVNTPEVLRGYNIDSDVVSDFQNVKRMAKNGEKERVKSLYPNTFWAYYF